jgi:sialidase-1
MVLRILSFTLLWCLAVSCADNEVSIDLWDYNAFPDIVKLPSGRILCVFYNGWSHASYPIPKRYVVPTDGGRIMLSHSDDDGVSWSKPIEIYDGNYDDRDPSISLLSTGQLICSFDMVDNGVSKGCALLHSDDGGKTWSSPAVIHPTYYTSSPIVELSDGSLVAGLFYEDIGRDSVIAAFGAVVRSTNLGLTWSEAVRIPNPKNLTFDAETAIIETVPGELYAVLRTSDLKRNMHYARSSDAGVTWQESKDIGFPGHAPYLFRVSSDSVILAQRFPGTSIRFSVDNCKTWGKAIQVSDATGAYPSIARLSKKEILIAFYDDQANVLNQGVIRFRKFLLTNDVLTWTLDSLIP